MSPMQRFFSNLVCQQSVTSYVIDAYLCLAILQAWTLEYQHMMLCVYEDRKLMASWRRPPGRPRNVWLIKVQKDANYCQIWKVKLFFRGTYRLCGTRFRKMPTFYCYLRSGDLRSPGVMEGHNGSLGLRDDDDDDKDDDKTCVKNGG